MRHPAIAPAACALVMLTIALSSCSSRGADEIEWARAALARNPALELIAVDTKTGIFTIKEVGSGTVRTVAIQDIVAAPAGMAARTEAAPTPLTDQAPAVGDSATPDPDLASTDVAPPADNAASEPVSEDQAAALATSGTGKTLMSGPGYSISRADKTTQRPSAAPPESENGNAGIAVASASVPVRAEPIICQGQRFMRIDGQTISSAGNAIVAEDGCDLHITNTRVRAGGVAITVRNARVHLTNSTVVGQAASIEASGSAEVYSTRTTFEGISRRFDEAAITDLGGTTFR
ncbi:MAG: hypothetical protein KDI32_12195 [Pseudomonadales bacterium]|jgi:hypothetical protein|nr:hypothetical protein [Pseudomonadales bacterium]